MRGGEKETRLQEGAYAFNDDGGVLRVEAGLLEGDALSKEERGDLAASDTTKEETSEGVGEGESLVDLLLYVLEEEGRSWRGRG